MYVLIVVFFFFFKQKTAYEMRISDWSSDVCSSDLTLPACRSAAGRRAALSAQIQSARCRARRAARDDRACATKPLPTRAERAEGARPASGRNNLPGRKRHCRSEEHTSELQSLMRISYAVFCLKKQTRTQNTTFALKKVLPSTTTVYSLHSERKLK